MGQQRAYMSFGGGVQSTTLAMLALNKDDRLLEVTGGALPELYLFADTGDERLVTYRHVWEMAERICDAGYNFLVTYKGHLSHHLIEKCLTNNGGSNTIPFFIQTAKGNSFPVRRGCTANFKVRELDRAAKAYWGVARGGKLGGLDAPVQHWLGISLDEAQRMRTTDEEWRDFFYPLVEMGWRRSHCSQYLSEMGVEATRSSCVYCPFHGSSEWIEVKRTPEDWERVLEVDEALEEGFQKWGVVAVLQQRPTLTKHPKPIKDVDFGEGQISLFGWECAGVCGV